MVGARHFDKVMFTLPIPRFDAETKLHADLAAAGAEAERVAAQVELPDDIFSIEEIRGDILPWPKEPLHLIDFDRFPGIKIVPA